MRAALVRPMMTVSRIAPRRHALLDLGDHQLDRHHVLDADVMMRPLRQDLVLDLDRREASRLRHAHGAVHVHGVAEPAGAIEHERQRRHGANVERGLAHLRDVEVGLGDALHVAGRAAAEVGRLEARLIGKPVDLTGLERSDDMGTIVLEGITVSLSAEGAAALNETFGVTLFTEGLAIGDVTVRATA